MGVSNIEWTDRTWNPVVGCTKVSAGCKNCYAKTLHDQRHKAHGEGKAVPAQYAHPFETVQLMPDRLRDPLSWKKPQRVFVNSVSDLFHEDIPDEFIVKCFAVMLLSQRHTYQVLTKRPQRMRRVLGAPNFGECVYDMAFDLSHQWMCGGLIDHVPEVDVLPNVWLGTSVENQAVADERVPYLLATPAAVRFLSCEPLLGPVDLEHIRIPLVGESFMTRSALEGTDGLNKGKEAPGRDKRVGWVIVGGESGHGSRPMQLGWARSLVEQCKAAGVPCFVKQLGAHCVARVTDVPDEMLKAARSCGQGDTAFLIELGLKDKKGGEPSEWPADLRVREFPANAT